ncbi:MAG: sulfotransferase [Chloroflexi bacterium]|nr:sulfotransferase [Chloroflexota bacterium]
MIPPRLFILSTGRAGSRSIAHLLSAIHGCTCVHEPAPQLIFEASAYRHGEISAAEIGRLMKETRPISIRGERYCESNQNLSLIIPVLAATFPEARFLWLVRNGLDMVASAYSKQWYSGHSERHDLYEDCTPLEKAWIDGRIEGDRCGDVEPALWDEMDRFARICWYWTYVNRLIESDLQCYAPDRFMLVRLETLDTQLPKMLPWLELRAAIVPRAKRINPSIRPPYPWQTWSLEHRAVFERWCIPLMNQLYPQWYSSNGEWRSVPYLQRSSLLPDWLNRYTFLKTINRYLSPNPLT